MQREFDFIKNIRAAASRGAGDGPLIKGIGDDAAIWNAGEGLQSLISTDLLVEDVDFKSEYTIAAWLGHKALAVSLSDIAAMGGRPRFSLLSLGIPRSFGERFWNEFFEAYLALADRYGVRLIGGDTSSSPDRLVLDSIVIGECPSGRAVRRDGARVGDEVLMTGTVGASAVGLRQLLNGARVDERIDDSIQRAVKAHLRPDPPVEFGARLGESGLAHSMIDISDGLVQDLRHICEESGVSAELFSDAVALAPEMAVEPGDHWAKFVLAASGGEDFQLLFTAPPGNVSSLMALATECGITVTSIGRIVAGDQAGITAVGSSGTRSSLQVAGFDHFA